MAVPQGSNSTKPSLKDLSNHVVPDVDHKWYSLGVQLFDDKDVKVLTSIEVDYRGDVDACCTKMFERWLEIVPNASWSQLINGLKAPNVKLHKLANDLSTEFGVQDNLDDSTHSGELSLRPCVYSQPGPPYHSTPAGSPGPSQASHVEVSYVVPENCDIEFSVLVTNISDMIQQSSNSQHFASIKQALAHVTVHPMCPKPLFSDAELARIKLTKDVFELAEMCRTHWSWNNYSLLKLIVKKSGSKDAKTELQRFSRTVNARKRLKELESSWLHDGKSCPEGFQSMMVIVDEDYDDITIEQLDKVEKFISEITGLCPQAMRANTVCKISSVLIKWWIPNEAIPFVVMMAFQNKEKFLRQSFLLLRIAGMDVFNLCRPSPKPSTETIDVLKRTNSILSEDCDRYIGEVSTLSMERDDLSDQVTKHKEKIEKLELEKKEKDNEIQQLKKDVERLGRQVMYLNNKVNAVQDHLRGKKPSNLGKTGIADDRQKSTQLLTQSSQQTQYMMHQPYQPLSWNYPTDDGSSLGSSSSYQGQSSSHVDLRRYDSSGIHEQAFMPTTSHTPPGQYMHTPNFPPPAPTTVKERVTAINVITAEEQHTVQYNIKPPAVPHQKYARSKTPTYELVTSTEKYARSRTPDFEVGMSTSQTTELQVAFNKRSSNELDLFQYEERVQQNIQKQKSNGEFVKQHTYAAGQVTTVGDKSAYRRQQERPYHYAGSQDTY